MAIIEITPTGIRSLSETSFHAAGIRERTDLQRLLRDRIEIISPDTLVIAEEFGEWEDSRRRIDLLGLEKSGDLVVIELKRTEDGGHMELQAIRYAAMVSGMTFEKAVDVYASYLCRSGSSLDAKTEILQFLGWEEPDEDRFAQDVRIVLVSAEFSKELTTAVMWLNERDLDIRCVRMKPYVDDGRIIVDVQQIIPLPEAEDYIVRIKEKEERERTARQVQSDLGKRLFRFWGQLLVKAKARTDLHGRISPGSAQWISAGAGISGLGYNYVVARNANRVELYIATGDRDTNKKIFDQLLAMMDDIERRFGGPLSWERLDEKVTCRIRASVGGSFEDEADWPELQDNMIDAMVRFEAALRPGIETVRR